MNQKILNVITIVLTVIGLIFFLTLIRGFSLENLFGVGVFILIAFCIYKILVKLLFKNKIRSSINNSIKILFSIIFLLVSVPCIIIGGYFTCISLTGGIQGFLFMFFLGYPFLLVIGIFLLILAVKRIFLIKKEDLQEKLDGEKKINRRVLLIITGILVIGGVIYSFFPRLYISSLPNITQEQEDLFYECYKNIGNERYSCIKDVAVKYQNEEFCEKIPTIGTDWKSGCYKYVAAAKKDPELCKKAGEIGGEYSEKECYEKVSIATKDPFLCEKVGLFKADCLRVLELDEESLQEVTHATLHEEEESFMESFDNSDITLTILNLKKIVNPNNFLNKVNFSFEIENKSRSDIKIPTTSVGKIFIFDSKDIHFMNSKLINNDFREETDEFNIIIKPGEVREFSIETEVASLKSTERVSMGIESFNYSKDNKISSLNLSLSLINNEPIRFNIGSRYIKESIAYIKEIDNGNKIEIVTDNGNRIIEKGPLDSFLIEYTRNSDQGGKLGLYKETINNLDLHIPSPVGCLPRPTIDYSTEFKMFKILEIEGLEPC
ncbi:MAG TPA: DMT family transporter [Candidatus Pacearchaeota archaeon]|nr:DMT family transporter [Candidatus Pacearchaeota archaeon]